MPNAVYLVVLLVVLVLAPVVPLWLRKRDFDR